MTGLRVLLLDNDPDALRLATDMLAAEGYTIYACSSCEHAGRMAALVRPRVYLLHGCDSDETDAFRNLLAADPFVPLVHFSSKHGAYEVYTARGRKHGYKRAGNIRYPTISSAIRAALLNALEAA